MTMRQGFSLERVGALVSRYVYLLRRSPIRILELIYWPFLNLVVWGFITVYLRGGAFGVPQAAGLFLGAVVLWEVMIRSNLGMIIPFIEELYTRNLGHLFISPLRSHELIAACMLSSLLRTLVGLVPPAVIVLPLFGFSIFGLGAPLIAFYFMLSLFGWSFGVFIMAILIRWGLAAEGFAWASVFVILPVAGVYYPIAALPHWLQPVAWSLPTAYVFEGMRAIVLQHVVRGDYLAMGFALNLVYLALGVGVFQWMFRIARARGLLLNAS